MPTKVEANKAFPALDQQTKSDLTKLDQEITLSERIARYGKLRVFFLCDENLGRSPMFMTCFKKAIKARGLEEFVEVMSAGTDVKEKGSDKKYNGDAHPVVRNRISYEDLKDSLITQFEGLNDHQVTQFDLSLLNQNTILFVLNDINKLPSNIRDHCYAVLDCGMDDPYEKAGSLENKLSVLHEFAFNFSLEFARILMNCFMTDSLAIFRGLAQKKVNVKDYFCYIC